MKSKMWFFNKTLFKKDITRFAPVWGIYTVVLLLTGIQSFEHFHSANFNGWDYQLMHFEEGIYNMVPLHFILALITASCLFGDLTRSRMSLSVHALPVRREQIYVTHFAAGILFSLVPNTALVLIQCCRIPDWSFLFFAWLGSSTMQYLFFFSLAAVCCICTGSRFATVAMYTFLNFLSLIVFWFYQSFYEPLLPGVHVRENAFIRFCPLMQISSQNEMIQIDYFGYPTKFEGFGPGWGYLGILAGLAVVLFGLGIWLYRKRHLERAGDFFCFQGFLPVFSALFSLSFAGAFSFFGGTAPMIVGFAVGSLCVEMLMRRTLSVFDRKFFKKFAIVGGLFLLSLFLTFLDPLGVTRWVPEPQDVASVKISNDYYYNPQYDRRQVYSSESDNAIREVTQIHKLILKEDSYLFSDSKPIHITYIMKDGRTVVRRYHYPSGGSASDKIDQYIKRPEFILGYEDWDTYLASVVRVVAQGYEFTGDDARELATAVRDDALEGWIDDDLPQEYFVYIKTTEGHSEVRIPDRCPRTIAWLKAHIEDME